MPGRLFWTRSVSLTARILAVNIIALGLLAGSLFYIDSYRRQLMAERFSLARAEVQISGQAVAAAKRGEREELIAGIGKSQGLRLRLYDAEGKLLIDSFALSGPSFQLIDPASEPWYQHAARLLDRGMDYLLGAPPIPDYRDPEQDSESAFPEVARARAMGMTMIRQRLAPDRTPVITAATPVGSTGEVLLTTRNPTDITQNVRDARQTLVIVVGVALFISVQLSLFLARTIIQPLRTLVRAAVRVRLGRAREVIVPRLPERRDEIGLLARAVSDMAHGLRHRIDAVEAFAADVAHEIKNPLASLRSAIETLERVDDAALRQQLIAIAAHDVRRIDRLITEIADASRIDAELSRATFEQVDLAAMLESLLAAREQAGMNGGHPVITQGSARPALVAGVPARLERIFENLLDNAVSFSPPEGQITVQIASDEAEVSIAVLDDGPGIPPEARHQVFERFHSLRPQEEDFGSHSGLGLAIARTIAEAHDGTLEAADRSDGQPGACLILRLPAWIDEASE